MQNDVTVILFIFGLIGIWLLPTIISAWKKNPLIVTIGIFAANLLIGSKPPFWLSLMGFALFGGRVRNFRF